MKKILGILSTFVLTSSTVIGLTSNINTNQIKLNNSNDQIDWTAIKNNNNEYFKNLKKNANQKLFSTTQNKYVDIQQIINYAKEKTNEYIAELENQNLNSNQIIEFLSTQNSDFKENYNKTLVESAQKSNNILFNNFSFSDFNSLFSSNDDIPTWKKNIQNLKTQKAVFQTITTTAAIASAGFWAAAWWFGISIPWAIGCTTISVAAGLITSIISEAIIIGDRELTEIEKIIGSAAVATKLYLLGQKIFLMLYSTLMAEEVVISAAVWSFPPAAIVASIVATIVAWITLYK